MVKVVNRRLTVCVFDALNKCNVQPSVVNSMNDNAHVGQYSCVQIMQMKTEKKRKVLQVLTNQCNRQVTHWQFLIRIQLDCTSRNIRGMIPYLSLLLISSLNEMNK